MSVDERKSESLLLKERYCLIQSGTDKHDIKLRLPVLYLRGTKYAEVVNSTLVKTIPPDQTGSVASSAPDSPRSSKSAVPSQSTCSEPDI